MGHEGPTKPQWQPHPHTERTYGAKVQYAQKADETPLLSEDDKTYIQQVVGVLLYYGRAVDLTLLVALSSIGSAQATPTATTMELIKIILNYAATNLDAILFYKKSDKVLAVHSDASYLSEPKARSRVGGHFFMSSDTEDPPNNGAVLNISKIILSVMFSVADAELAALYVNVREAILMKHLLEAMGHKHNNLKN